MSIAIEGVGAANVGSAARTDRPVLSGEGSAETSKRRETSSAAVKSEGLTTLLSGLSPSSATFSSVAEGARVTLDAGYRALGRKADASTSATDWEKVFGGMDRRSLYAVASNQDGRFSVEEQDSAKYLMRKQQERAMGLDSPLVQIGAVDPKTSAKAAVAFLDGVSDEEKAGSFEWAQQRAIAQWSYETLSRRDGEEPEALDSGDMMVKLIKSAQEALAALNDPTKQLSDMTDFKTAEKLHQRVVSGAPGLVDVEA